VLLDGGWQTLVDGLRESAARAGVSVVTGSRVVAVEHDAFAADADDVVQETFARALERPPRSWRRGS
jgi:phytoene dehydrogenase-like protein